MENTEIHLKQMLKAAENWAKFHQVILHIDVEFIIRQKSLTKIHMHTVVLCRKI